jgi:hypothetical protein
MVKKLIEELRTHDPEQIAVLLELAKSNFRREVCRAPNYFPSVPEIRSPHDTDAAFDAGICSYVAHGLSDWSNLYGPSEIAVAANSAAIVYFDQAIESFANAINQKEIYTFLSTDADVIDFIKLGYRQPFFVVDWDKIESEFEEIELDYSDLERRYQFIAPPTSAVREPSSIKKVTYSDLFNIEYEIEPIEETEEE